MTHPQHPAQRRQGTPPPHAPARPGRGPAGPGGPPQWFDEQAGRPRNGFDGRFGGDGRQGWNGPPAQRRPVENDRRPAPPPHRVAPHRDAPRRDDQRYDDQRYDDRRHDDRRYDDRRYDDRRGSGREERFRDDRYDDRYDGDRRAPRRQAAYDDYDERPRRRPAAAPVRQRRKVWPWVVLGLVLLPVLGVVGCVALVGGAATVVDNARQGGTVAIGETFTYQSGLALSVSPPAPYTPSNEFLVSEGNTAYEATVTITNGTTAAVSTVLVTKNATVANAPAQEVFDDNWLPTQDIAPGQALAIPFRFQVPDGTTGSLQIAVTDTFNEPVFFTGHLG